MAGFSELVKNFDNVRGYMRDFYIYGFKSRNDFLNKSSRTYDNEKRRVEIWLGNCLKWNYSFKSKKVFISIDSSNIEENLFYEAWKNKSFTDNDIMLHFYILDLLKEKGQLTAAELADSISLQFEKIFEVQTIRNKAKEYVSMGILKIKKEKNKDIFFLNKDDFEKKESFLKLIDGIKLFSEIAPLGIIGNFILHKNGFKNDLFKFKHYFIVHTLDDGILLKIVEAIYEKREITIENYSRRKNNISKFSGVPCFVLISVQSGRRYLSIMRKSGNLSNVRLDYILNVEHGEIIKNYDNIKEKAENIKSYCWGVSMKGQASLEEFIMHIYADEKKENYIIKRLEREKRNGTVKRIKENVYEYKTLVYDTNELLSWVKTFIGRIIFVDGSNKKIVKKLYNDMEKMQAMYGE